MLTTHLHLAPMLQKEYSYTSTTPPLGLCGILLPLSFTFYVKSKFLLITCDEEPEGEEGICSTLSLTSTLDRVSGSRHAPAALRQGK